MARTNIFSVLSISLRLCWLEISSNKVRSVISSLGIFLGTASLLVNLTFLRGMNTDIQNTMALSGGVTIVTIRAVGPQNKEEQLTFARSGGLTLANAYDLQRQIPAIESVLPQTEMRSRLMAGQKRSGGAVIAVGPQHVATYNYQIDEGRTFSPEDFSGRAKTCLVGSGLAERLFGTKASPIGKSISFRGIPFVISGIIATKDRFDGRNRQMLIPFPTYQQFFGGQFMKVNQIAVKIDKKDNIKPATKAIKSRLQALHRGVSDFEIEVNEDRIKEMETAARGIQILLGAIAIISLSVGSISIMNIMFATIGERIREIGVRKALGAQRIDIFLQFLAEGIILSLVGGIPGILLGSSTIWFPEGTFPFQPLLAVSDYIMTIFLVLGAGLLSGLFPAFKASTMEPIEALRY